MRIHDTGGGWPAPADPSLRDWYHIFVQAVPLHNSIDAFVGGRGLVETKIFPGLSFSLALLAPPLTFRYYGSHEIEQRERSHESKVGAAAVRRRVRR